MGITPQNVPGNKPKQYSMSYLPPVTYAETGGVLSLTVDDPTKGVTLDQSTGDIVLTSERGAYGDASMGMFISNNNTHQIEEASLNASICAGENNSIGLNGDSTNSCIINGANNVIDYGVNNVCAGNGNVLSGDNSTVIGSQNSVIDSNDSFVAGFNNTNQSGSNFMVGFENMNDNSSNFIIGAHNSNQGSTNVIVGFENINQGSSTVIIGNNVLNDDTHSNKILISTTPTQQDHSSLGNNSILLNTGLRQQIDDPSDNCILINAADSPIIDGMSANSIFLNASQIRHTATQILSLTCSSELQLSGDRVSFTNMCINGIVNLNDSNSSPYVVQSSQPYFTVQRTGTQQLTLPSINGFILTVRNRGPGSVTSTSSNINLDGVTSSTILPAVAGRWVKMIYQAPLWYVVENN